MHPGDVYRAVALFNESMVNETSTGAPICDNPSGKGWVMLCDGFCDLATCSNVLDYFEKWDGVTAPSSPPACASFSPAPLSVAGALPGDSATRVGFMGSGAAGVQTDWIVAPMSRE
jgi:hypothetical protein